MYQIFIVIKYVPYLKKVYIIYITVFENIFQDKKIFF